MQKTTPTLGRILVMSGFALSCFALLLFLWLAFGGAVPLQPKGYRFHVTFKEASQLAQEADVRISGVPVGKVTSVDANPRTGRTDATIELERRFAPLPQDARATLRQKTLLGETYVELTPGDARGPRLPEGGRLAPGQVSPTVELDEILRAFDAPTRERLQTYIQQNAVAGRGRAQDISDALGNLAPFAEDTRRLLVLLDEQEPAVRGLVRDTGTVFGALSERDGQLRTLIEQSERVFATTARNADALEATFRALPTFQREGRETFRRLTRFAEQTDPLVTQLRPAARELSPALQDIERLAPDLRGLLRDIDPLVDASRKGLPATERFLDDLRPFLGELEGPSRQLNPILALFGGATNELRAFFANSVAATQASTGTGPKRIHYLRTTNPLNIESLAVSPRRYVINRNNAYAIPGRQAQLGSGLLSFDVRHCDGRPLPKPPTEALEARGQAELAERIERFAFTPERERAAPPCRPQGPFGFGGRSTAFPQVTALPAR